MRQPEIYTVKTLMKWSEQELGENELGRPIWNPARPIGHRIYPFTWRWRLAWFVLIGKFDAVHWGD